MSILSVWKKVIILFAVLAVTLSIISCGKKKVKPVPAESRRVQESIQRIDEIKDAYLRKNTTVLKSLTTPDGYREIIAKMKNFDSAELHFTPKWVDIKGDSIYLYISWTGTWKLNQRVLSERGFAAFVLEGNQQLLDRILRESPFSYPEE